MRELEADFYYTIVGSRTPLVNGSSASFEKFIYTCDLCGCTVESAIGKSAHLHFNHRIQAWPKLYSRQRSFKKVSGTTE